MEWNGTELEYHQLILLRMIFMCPIVWMTCTLVIILRFNGEKAKNIHMVWTNRQYIDVSILFFFFTDLIAITCNVYSSPILDIIMVLNFELIIQIFLAGWWYGVVGHLASCNGNKHFCHCHDNGKEQNTLASCYYSFVTICVCN